MWTIHQIANQSICAHFICVSFFNQTVSNSEVPAVFLTVVFYSIQSPNVLHNSFHNYQSCVWSISITKKRICNDGKHNRSKILWTGTAWHSCKTWDLWYVQASIPITTTFLYPQNYDYLFGPNLKIYYLQIMTK